MKISYLIILTALMLSACSTTKNSTKADDSTAMKTEEKASSVESKTMASASKVMGTWSLTVMDTPDGNVDAEMMIEQVNGEYKAFMIGDSEKTEIKNLKVEGNNVSGTFYAAEYALDIPFSLKYDDSSDQMIGNMMDSFQVEGKRKM